MAASASTSSIVMSNEEFIAALEDEAVSEIIIGSSFTINHWNGIHISRRLVIDGRGNNINMSTGLTILFDGVTIKNMNISVANVRHILVFDIGNHETSPKDITIEHCNIEGMWKGEINKYGGCDPYHSAISVRENTRVTVKDTTVKNCATGITVSDFAVCILDNVSFENNNVDKELSVSPFMYGGVATPTGVIQEINSFAKYKQFVKE